MPPYTLIEYKLRRYLYLGHEYSIYIPTPIKNSMSERKHHDDVTGVRIIGKIIKKNKTEEINSIVPIILKIKKEDKLHDDKLLIYTLAVCARFNLKPCMKMVADAHAAISTICTDGLKLLMFVKFYETAFNILLDEGYIVNATFGFTRHLRKALNKWYLDRDPLLTAEQIVRHKSHDGWSHKDIMKLIHIHSVDPSRKIFIIHTLSGIDKVEELYGPTLKDVQIDNDNESFENKQLKFIYNHLKQVNSLKKMDEKTLRNEIELNRWGHEFEVIPQKMLLSSKILTSLVMHMPLKTLLENTFFFAKQRLFCNSTPDVGLWEFILRFNNTIQLQKSRIHPIESFIEYVRYSRTSQYILKLQNSSLKKQSDLKIELPENKLKVFLNKNENYLKNDDESNSQNTNKTFEKSLKTKKSSTQVVTKCTKLVCNKTSKSKSKKNNIQNCNLTSSAVEEKYSTSELNLKSNDQILKDLNPTNEVFDENTEKQNQNQIVDNINLPSSLESMMQQCNFEIKPKDPVVEWLVQSNKDHNYQNQSDEVFILLKPPPKQTDHLLKFLSEDLIRKTLENLKSSDRRILISYDSRMCMKEKYCLYTHMLMVHEAITLITLSLIYPEKVSNKPCIRSLNESAMLCDNVIEIDYNQPLTFTSLESILFKIPDNDSDLDEKCISNTNSINTLSTFDWAIKNNKEYDIFLFLGTNTMNLLKIKKAIEEYKSFLKKSVKVIICCLNGNHKEQINLGRGNILFIAGFDKNVGKVINSFINEEF